MRVITIAALALLGVSLSVRAQIQVTDDTGRTVTLAQPARRIISLAPHITELLFDIGAGARIVGVVEFSDYPPAARAIPRIGRYDRLAIESIVAAQPDLVVGWRSGNPRADLALLKQLGMTVFLSEPHRLDDIATDLSRLGLLTGRNSAGGRAAHAFRRRLQRLTAANRDKPPITVFYQVSGDPLITLNGTHPVSDLIRRCGGSNVFASLGPIAPHISIEAVLAANPAVIIAGRRAGRTPDWTAAWRRWPRLDAVRRHHLYRINPDLLVRSTPRILDGMAALCADLDRARAAPAPANGGT